MVRIILISTAIAVAVYFGIALVLIFTDAPGGVEAGPDRGLDFDSSIRADYSGLPNLTPYTARDGTELGYRFYASATPTDRLVILVHGSAWHGMQFHGMARALAETGIADVVAPDMRGHGASPARRGDIDHIGQLEEDMADLIDHLKKRKPDARIVLGGHSSGGGFVVRFAGGEYRDKVDGFALLAPFLKYNAPTTRANSGGWANPAVRRIIGLTMLNSVGVTALNHLPVIRFAMPKAVLDGPYGKTATTIYSYRMNAGFAPRSDYEADLARIDRPLLVIAGAEDEAFFADRYEAVISAETKTGTYKVLPGVNHMGVVTEKAAWDTLAGWLEKSFPAKSRE